MEGQSSVVREDLLSRIAEQIIRSEISTEAAAVEISELSKVEIEKLFQHLEKEQDAETFRETVGKLSAAIRIRGLSLVSELDQFSAITSDLDQLLVFVEADEEMRQRAIFINWLQDQQLILFEQFFEDQDSPVPGNDSWHKEILELWRTQTWPGIQRQLLSPPKKSQYQRAHETLEQTMRRLSHKYGNTLMLNIAEGLAQGEGGTTDASIPDHAIRHNAACKKYHVSSGLLSTWIKRGQVKVLKRLGQQVFIDERDIHALVNKRLARAEKVLANQPINQKRVARARKALGQAPIQKEPEYAVNMDIKLESQHTR